VNVALLALGTFLAIPQCREGAAHGRPGSHPDVSVPTLGVRAPASKEMHTGRGSVGRGLMGKITAVTCAAFAGLQKLLAHSHFAGVVHVGARRALVASP
jgi:hypothetical protein